METHGPEKARDIITYIKIVSFGNLIGNMMEDFAKHYVETRRKPEKRERELNRRLEELEFLRKIVFSFVVVIYVTEVEV